MKILMPIALFLVNLSASGQIINVFKDGSSSQHTVKATSASGIYTEIGWIQNSAIDSIQIVEEGSYSQSLRETYMRSKSLTPGIQKHVTDKNTAIGPVSPVIKAPTVAYIEVPNYTRFTSQRSAGKALQLVGVMALGVTSYIALQNSINVKNGKLDKVKDVSPAIPLAAYTIMTIGIVIDIDANKWLVLRPKN